MWILLGLAALGLVLAASPSRKSSTTAVGIFRGAWPTIPVTQVNMLYPTKGDMTSSGRINSPTFRAVCPGTSGEAVALDFVYRGGSSDVRALASGQIRRQIGLKLRAMNGCNLVYAMWRIDPKPQLEVSVKINPGKRVHKECGASGYTKIKPSYYGTVPDLVDEKRHSIHAEIVGDEMSAWLDGQLVWHGTLPEAARSVAGPSGIRSDNVSYDIVDLKAPASQAHAGLPQADGED